MIDYELACLAELVYRNDAIGPDLRAINDQGGWRLVERLGHAGSEAMLCRKVADDDWALVPRGTEASRFSTSDLWANVGYPVRWAGPGWMHSGYRTQLGKVRFPMRRLAEKVPADHRLWIGGHSMGGTLCPPYAAWVLGGDPRWRHRIHGLVTFGAPKSLSEEGWRPILEALAAGSLEVRQHVMPGDLAPYWQPFLFSNRGPEVRDKVPEGVGWDTLSRHDPATYRRALALSTRAAAAASSTTSAVR